MCFCSVRQSCLLSSIRIQVSRQTLLRTSVEECVGVRHNGRWIRSPIPMILMITLLVYHGIVLSAATLSSKWRMTINTIPCHIKGQCPPCLGHPSLVLGFASFGRGADITWTDNNPPSVLTSRIMVPLSRCGLVQYSTYGNSSSKRIGKIPSIARRNPRAVGASVQQLYIDHKDLIADEVLCRDRTSDQ
ncbi:hypothetical protein P152DRAFT_208039 [Eremomyces bilateralis CBS 781.70]|uniref:Uncharacterized protein n=1 Tax=Eremomyces bilateralis CBS 781.70 TaxID=1392243 RepID=A0A6G1FSQ7_9PEZI|nr:uncharacterized protein P152DRAFT_208039 [Eremomyces bilateralis CBS 781.70]KAF1808748.1 hypothetical protein P152DRAFT_208039 [Eremomyces bilateralis CBS 781.70]